MHIFGAGDGKDTSYLCIAVLRELTKELVDQGVLSQAQMAEVLEHAKDSLQGAKGDPIDRGRDLLVEHFLPMFGG